MARASRKDRVDIIGDYKAVFGSAAGKRVLADLERSYNNRTSIVPGDPYMTAFHEGERHVYLAIVELLNVNPADLAKVSTQEDLEADA